MALSFAEWSQQGQPQQPAGSSASAPSFQQWSQGQGAPSFQQWSQNPQAPAAGENAPKLGGIWDYKGRETTDASAVPTMEGVKLVLKTPAQHGQNEGGEFDLPAMYEYQLDPEALPKTKYGSILDVWQADRPGGFQLKNPAAKTYDPNYGWISHSSNYIDPSSQRDVYDLIGPLAMSAVFGLAGMGAFGGLGAGQGMGLNLGRAAQGFLQSGGRNWSGIAGVAGSLTGIPGAGTAASYLASRVQGRDPGLMSVAPGAAMSFANWLARGS